ncbi:extracellular solute-binding protein [Selenomonas caprae]|uniref:Extracellular solute-binding protein n=1 Tax=Selenomonas caprae TaxID=2606905 RepID=A0A5D6WN66_9FIRM|nr:extracellular solute-binding protein [Selenomonas caprae]TYZ28338.1 extracellular solute-binding protein [Selenomonas caprae]
MRRYTSLLLTSFLLLLVVVAGSAYLAGAGHDEQQRPRQEITVYTTLPAEHVTILTAAYEKQHGVRVNFVPLPAEKLLNRLQEQAYSGKDGEAAMVLADRETLAKAAAAGYLVPYLSEAGDQVQEDFREENGYWVGVWYDPIVFCVNKDYLKTQAHIPDTWQDLAKQKKVRIGVTDFLAADASANLLISMIAQFGDAAAYDIWRQLHPKVVQYARYLSTPVRQAGMGEVDIAVGVESETIRYMQDGYPLQVVYPADGTAAIVTGTGMAYRAEPKAQRAAKEFADWLLGDDAQLALQERSFYFVPTNPGTLAYKMFAGKNLVLFNQPASYTAQQKHDFLDRWVKEVRFK